MKKLNTVLSVLTLSMMVMIFAGCQPKKGFYPFQQERENITTVEICSLDLKTKVTTPLIELSDEAQKSLLTELSTLEGNNYFPMDGPQGEYGDVVICVRYIDGTGELIGQHNTAHIKTDGTLKSDVFWFYHWDVRALILRYVDRDLLESISGEYWSADKDQFYATIDKR